MADITFPANLSFTRYAEMLEFAVDANVGRNLSSATRQLPGSRWCVKATLAPHSLVNGAVARGAAEALLASLRGGVNTLVLSHPYRPVPSGTLRGTPTLSATAAIGATSATFAATTGQTVLPGDIFSLGGQRIMAIAAATAASSAITITWEPALRVAVASGTALVWNSPTLRLGINPSVSTRGFWVGYSGKGMAEGIDLDLCEVWS